MRTRSEIQDAANIDRIGKLRANGHAFEFTTFRTQKGTFGIGLRMWHRNDTRRLNTLPGALQGHFTSRPYALAYIRQLLAA
jgi:hypothetical protein